MIKGFKKMRIAVIGLLAVLLSLSLFACSRPETPGGNEKPQNGDDFGSPSNISAADYTVDGILDEDIYSSSEIHSINYGEGNNINVKIYWGATGLTVGWTVRDTDISVNKNYSVDMFVNQGDSVELYIDTLNDGGGRAQVDDYQLGFNPEGFALLKVGTGSNWGLWSGIVDYAATFNGTINNDSDVDTGYCVETFLPYSTFGFDADSAIGLSLGSVGKKTVETTYKWTGWKFAPDPHTPNRYVAMSKDSLGVPSIKGFEIANGSFVDIGGGIKTTAAQSLAISETEFSTGTIEVDIKGEFNDSKNSSAPAGNHGIVFGVNAGETTTFWETQIPNYYFFQITKGDTGASAAVNRRAMLGATKGNAAGTGWLTLVRTPDHSHSYGANATTNIYDSSAKHTFKLVLDAAGLMRGYIDGKLTLWHDFGGPVTGAIGLRSDVINTEFTDFNVSPDIPAKETSANNFVTKIGMATAPGDGDFYSNSVRSNGANAIAFSNATGFTTGTVSTKISPRAINDSNVAASDNGIIFGIQPGNTGTLASADVAAWEASLPNFYFLYVNATAKTIGLKTSKGAGNTWETLVEHTRKAINNAEYTLKLVVEADGKVSGFIDDTHVFKVDTGAPVTGYIGVKTSVAGTVFKDFTLDTIALDTTGAPAGSEDLSEVEPEPPVLLDGDLVGGGGFTDITDGIKSTAAKSIILFDMGDDAYNPQTAIVGTIEVEIKFTTNNSGDMGIVFGANPDGATTFYDTGIQGYYYFYINSSASNKRAVLDNSNGGTAITLSQGLNGSLTALGPNGADLVLTTKYKMKLVFEDNGFVRGYVNNDLVLFHDFGAPVKGFIGLRTSGTNSEFTNFTTTEAVTARETTHKHFIMKGAAQFVYASTTVFRTQGAPAGSPQSSTGLSTATGFAAGTTSYSAEVKIYPSGAGDAALTDASKNGIIFGVNPGNVATFADDKPFYLLYVQRTTGKVAIASSATGSLVDIVSDTIPGLLALNTQYTLKLVINANGLVTGYVDGTEVISHDFTAPVVGYIGVRAHATQTRFADFTLAAVI